MWVPLNHPFEEYLPSINHPLIGVSPFNKIPNTTYQQTLNGITKTYHIIIFAISYSHHYDSDSNHRLHSDHNNGSILIMIVNIWNQKPRFLASYLYYHIPIMSYGKPPINTQTNHRHLWIAVPYLKPPWKARAEPSLARKEARNVPASCYPPVMTDTLPWKITIFYGKIRQFNRWSFWLENDGKWP